VAFADPQALTYNAVSTDLPKVLINPEGSFYRALTALGATHQLSYRHSTGKQRARHSASFRRELAVTDPLIPAQNAVVGGTVTLSMDVPVKIWTPDDSLLMVLALMSHLSASSGANALKLAQGQS